MIVGVPREIKQDEYRVAMLPVGVEELTKAGHRVLIERGAGMFELDCFGPPRRFFSWSMIDWHSSMHSPQM